MYEKTMLQWYALERGHRVIYGTRFHCECAVIESVWAYIVKQLSTIMDGTASTLVHALINQLAFTIKPDVVQRLLNRPTLYTLLYSLGVASDDRIPAGLAAVDVFEIMRAFSGYGNKHPTTAAHAKASSAGAAADAFGDEPALPDDLEESDPLIEGERFAGPRPRIAAPPAPAAVAVVGQAAGPGVAAQAALLLVPSPSAAAGAQAAPFLPSLAPSEVHEALWELLSCVMDPARRVYMDKRRLKPAIFAAFCAAVQRAWDSCPSSRAALGILEGKTLGDMTPLYALRHAAVLCVGSRVQGLEYFSSPAAPPPAPAD
jgi:hypothetical protein